MNKFFSIDNKLFLFLEKIADLLILNILWIICCLPIITIGASTTAMYYMTLKMVRNEETYIVKGFLSSFKLNFIQATKIWGFSLIFLCVLGFDIFFFYRGEGVLFRSVSIMLLILGLAFLFMLIYVFPLLAKFDNSTVATIKNAFLLAISQIPYSMLIIILIMLPYVIVYYVPYLAIFLILFGGSGTALVTAYIFNSIFDKLIPSGTGDSN